MTANATPVTVTVAEAAELLSVSRPTVYKMMGTDSSFPAFKFGSRTLVNYELLKDWARQKTTFNTKEAI